MIDPDRTPDCHGPRVSCVQSIAAIPVNNSSGCHEKGWTHLLHHQAQESYPMPVHPVSMPSRGHDIEVACRHLAAV
eukprot:11149400-Karenia_brevis.AAC.1